MNFQERFKGKTSTISKEGIQSMVLSSTIPIKKVLTPSTNSTAQPNHRTSISIVDNSPKHPKRTPLSLTSTSQIPGTSTSMMLSDAQSPKMHSQTPSNKINLFTHIQNRNEAQKSLQHANSSILSFKDDDSPLMKRPMRKETSHVQNAKSVNLRQFSSQSALPDQSISDFNPNSFYNQHSQMIRPPFRAQTETAGQVQGPGGANLNANRNHLHRKNFESLSQQNKSKQISRDVFKDLYNPGYSQQYDNLQSEPRILFTEKTPRMYENASYQGSYTPSNGLNASGRYMMMDELNNYVVNTEQTPTNSNMRKQYRGSPDVRRAGNRGMLIQEHEDWTERRDIMRFSQLPGSVRASQVNQSALQLNKPRSEGSPGKFNSSPLRLKGIDTKMG